jgi:hypothetical protein
MRIDIPKEQRFLLKGNNPLNGIIAYLTGKYGGNVHDRSAVGVSRSSYFSDSHEAKMPSHWTMTPDSIRKVAKSMDCIRFQVENGGVSSLQVLLCQWEGKQPAFVGIRGVKRRQPLERTRSRTRK